MNLRPNSRDELAQMLRDANARGTPVGELNLGALDRVLEYTPEDMTVTVEAGATLHSLQTVLAGRGQWLPIDPPFPERLTIRELLDTNASGPRRFGHGTIRDHLIGLRVALADGRLIHSGGKVVKNVAGFDLLKLFIGALGSLGVIVEATFKLLPLPEEELIVAASCESVDHAVQLVESITTSSITPIVLDIHRLTIAAAPALVLGFAGPREDVAWQREEAARLGVNAPADLGYNAEFCAISPAQPLRRSVLPSRLGETLRELNGVPFVARAGNGIVHHRGHFTPDKSDLPLALLERTKAMYDPKRILPPLPL